MIDLEEGIAYHNVQKIDIASLSDRIEQIRAKETTALRIKLIEEKNAHDEWLTELNKRKTELIGFYLSNISLAHIKECVAQCIAKERTFCVLCDDWINKKNSLADRDIDRDTLLEIPLNQIEGLDLNALNLTEEDDPSQSIIQMLKDRVPDEFRVYNMYVSDDRRSYEITMRRGGWCCNDPCCLFLCFYNKACMYKTVYLCALCNFCEPVPGCRVCCGP